MAKKRLRKQLEKGKPTRKKEVVARQKEKVSRKKAEVASTRLNFFFKI